MLIKLPMSLSKKHELEQATITVRVRRIRVVFRFPEHDCQDANSSKSPVGLNLVRVQTPELVILSIPGPLEVQI
jgi:hypothetical protein